MNDSKAGKVFLLGAGPGDPELITVKALRILHECDVVIYDNLIPDELIVALPATVVKVYVGKRGGRPSIKQDGINQLILDYACSGHDVARLKGSDPIIFGRGGEEAMFLKENGIDYEIVPGVTSGIAAPIYAGIPCTDRNKSSALILVTGHASSDKYDSWVDWGWLAKAKYATLVVYMGVSRVNEISGELIKNGMDESTPAAVIERGTFSSMRSFVSSLRDLPGAVAKNDVKAPSIFVIGSVVDLKPYIDWFKKKPLLGKRVMVTRPSHQSHVTYEYLRSIGAEVMAYPSIEIREHVDEGGWDEFEWISDCKSWLVFTSENGVRFFVDQFVARYGDLRKLARFQIAAVGVGTMDALSDRCLKADFVATEATVKAFSSDFVRDVASEDVTVVRVRGNLAGSVFEDRVREKGASVLPLTVYATQYAQWPDGLKDKLFETPPHAAMFTSSSTVKGLFENLTDSEARRVLKDTKIFSIGPSTSETIEEYGLEIAGEPTEHNVPALIDTVTRYLTSQSDSQT